MRCISKYYKMLSVKHWQLGMTEIYKCQGVHDRIIICYIRFLWLNCWSFVNRSMDQHRSSFVTSRSGPSIRPRARLDTHTSVSTSLKICCALDGSTLEVVTSARATPVVLCTTTEWWLGYVPGVNNVPCHTTQEWTPVSVASRPGFNLMHKKIIKYVKP